MKKKKTLQLSKIWQTTAVKLGTVCEKRRVRTPTTDNLCATSIMKTIHDKGKDFKEYKTSGSYQKENSPRAGLTKEKVMRGEGALFMLQLHHIHA